MVVKILFQPDLLTAKPSQLATTLLTAPFYELICLMKIHCLSQPVRPGSVSQRVYELIIQISKKKIMLFSTSYDDPIRPQLCTCHDSWAVVTCANLWPGWIIRIMIIINGNFHDISIMNSWNLCEMRQWLTSPILTRTPLAEPSQDVA